MFDTTSTPAPAPPVISYQTPCILLPPYPRTLRLSLQLVALFAIIEFGQVLMNPFFRGPWNILYQLLRIAFLAFVTIFVTQATARHRSSFPLLRTLAILFAILFLPTASIEYIRMLKAWSEGGSLHDTSFLYFPQYHLRYVGKILQILLFLIFAAPLLRLVKRLGYSYLFPRLLLICICIALGYLADFLFFLIIEIRFEKRLPHTHWLDLLMLPEAAAFFVAIPALAITALYLERKLFHTTASRPAQSP